MPLNPEAEKSYAAMQEIISNIEARSLFKRETLDDGREMIVSPEGEKFYTGKLTNPQDPRLEKIIFFMVKNFTADETDTVETMQTAIRTNWGAYHVIEDKNGEIIGHSCVGLLDLPTTDRDSFEPQEPKSSILYLGYFITEEKFRNLGFARELYRQACQYAIGEATARQSIVKGIIGEHDEEAEYAFNKMGGQKRLYFEDQNSNWHEVPFQTAQHDWNPDSGEPLLGPTPEHLMVKLTNKEKDFGREELLQIVKAVYKDNYIPPREYFNNQAAADNNLKHVMALYDKLASALAQSKDGKIHMLDPEERMAKKKELSQIGKSFYEIVIEKKGAIRKEK